MDKQRFVFLDSGGKRWPRFRLTILAFSCLALVFSFVFIRSLLVLPHLQYLKKAHDLSKGLMALHATPKAIHYPKPLPAWLIAKPAGQTARTKAGVVHPDDRRPIRLGFYVNWDRNSYFSLVRHANKLTHLCPEWFTLAGMPPTLYDEPNRDIRAIAQANSIKLLPLLTNLKADRWQPEAVESLIRADRQAQSAFFEKIAAKLEEVGAAGVVVDFEQIDPAYHDEFTAFFGRMHERLARDGLELWLCIPVGNDIKIFDLEALSGVVDRFVAMLYDENGDDDPPGPLASQTWFAEWLKLLVGKVSPKQWVIGIGSYGYDWQNGKSPDTLSFADTMARANSAGESTVEDMPPYDGPHFEYTADGRNHCVWFLDAITFRNQKTVADRMDVGGIALWRLGTEDPQVWNTLDCVNSCEPHSFQKMKRRPIISSIGRGDFLTAINETADGLRTIKQDSTGLWRSRYVRFPKYPLLFHQGEDRSDQVAITFDDGPDPRWTPEILEILREKHVRATFFIIGGNAESYPDLVRQIVSEGHEIGNHTYSHPDLGEISPARLQLELNATQRLIESITGRSTILFRPPYNADRQPQSMNEFMTLVAAQGLGYMPVSESIDTEDWDRPDARMILERVRERRQEGNVVLLHDAGGDRSETVKALPEIIDYLRMRGDRIVPLNRLLGVSRDALMPPIPSDDPRHSRFVAQTGLRMLHEIKEFAWSFMILSTALLFLRSLLVLFFSVLHRWREAPTCSSPSREPVSAIIAAFNEAKVIRSTLLSLLDTDHCGELEIIVVDDGSTDDTSRIVREMAAEDPRIRLLRQENTGKAGAMNAGLAAARFEYIVTLDADTQFNKDTIARLLGFFDKEDVGAVSGHVKVGNLNSWIGRYQSLEYTCGFNLDRRAYDVLNCITVVPGAASAFRRSAIMKVGCTPSDTMAEDTDLTLCLHRYGYKIRYAPDAIGLTEAPETVRALIRQRIRWAYGTFQCLFKHRDLLFDPAYRALAFFSLPTAWFCHMFLVALIPAVDALVIVSLFTGAGRLIAVYALIFILLDLALAAAACMMEGERFKTALEIVPMRFVYRPLLSYAVWRSLFRALRGVWAAWGSQERKGTVAGRVCQG